MLRKSSCEVRGKSAQSQSPRPTRRSLPGSSLSTRPTRNSLSSPCPSPTPPRKLSTCDKRKTSRVHLGRMNYLPDYSNEEEPEPIEPISQYDFFMAASSGRIKAVTKYLDDGGDVNAVDSCKRTALHRASLYEQTAIVELLLQRGAKVNSADKLNNTPLHWACRGSNLEIVEILLNNKAQVNSKDKLMNSPLHVATRVGFIECVDYLIECGARINDKDCEGDSAIHDAIRLGRPKVVRSLILHGADMNTKNTNGKTAAGMVQAWYSNTKDALSNAEAERKRKGFDTEKVVVELEQGEGKIVDANSSETEVASSGNGLSSNLVSNGDVEEESRQIISKSEEDNEEISKSESMIVPQISCPPQSVDVDENVTISCDVSSDDVVAVENPSTENDSTIVSQNGNQIIDNSTNVPCPSNRDDEDQNSLGESFNFSACATSSGQETNEELERSTPTCDQVESGEEAASMSPSSDQENADEVDELVSSTPSVVCPPVGIQRRMSVEDALSLQGQKALSKMEEATPNIKERRTSLMGTRVFFQTRSSRKKDEK